jgi:polygalacturonase
MFPGLFSRAVAIGVLAVTLAGCTYESATPAAPPPAAPAGSGDFAPAQPVIPDRRFNLADFGAVPDGHTLNTAAFHAAVAAVNQAGGGTLVVPAGTWFTGPFDLCSNLDLHLDAGATILFSPRFEDYGSPPLYRPLLLASEAHDVMISGAGTINGSGEAWWPEALRFKAEANAAKAQSNTSPRPRMVVFAHCRRVRVTGVTLTHAPVFNLVPSRCEDVSIEDITILNPADSPNTDGIDPSNSRRVLIARCRIDTGDDCIAIKSGLSGSDPVEDILVARCAFFHGHGCSFGSDTAAGVRRVTIRDCTFEGTDIGVRLKSDRTRGGPVEDVTYENLTMKNVGQAIVITSYYPDREIPPPGRHVAAEPVSSTTPFWRHIVIRNMVATAGTKSAGMIMGLPEAPAAGITLENVRIAAPVGLRIGYAKDVTLRGVSVTALKGAPLLLEDTVEGLKRTE